MDVNPHNEHPGIILESEFFDEADFALRYSNIQRRVISARMGNSTSTAAASAAISTSLGDSSSSTSHPSSVNTATVVAPTAERDRKRNRYDPRWLDGPLREELFGRIDRELKPDDLSLVKDNSKNPASMRKEASSQPQPHSAPPCITTGNPNPVQFGDQLQFWTDSNNDTVYPRFTHIACLHSELIAINIHGQLCQWNWHEESPYQDQDNAQIKHPKTMSLQLFNERIVQLSGNLIRASVLTDNNRLATWIDDSLGSQVSFKLQHSAQEFSSQRLIDVSTSPFFTIVRTESNELFWYGLLPHKPRKKLLERLKEKTRHKHRSSTTSNSNSQQSLITVGCSVCLISNPYYNQGAWAFYIRDGRPKLGQLMEQAWVLSNTARFRLKPVELPPAKVKDEDKSSLEMPPPPSPASSTCSVDSNTSFASSLKRKKHSSNTTTTQTGSNPFLMTVNDSDSNDQQQHSKIKDEEHWPLDEVIFIEDCKVAPIGKVMKIDGSLVLVKFPSKSDGTEVNVDVNNLDNCRILRRDDLQIVKGNQSPKTPDCTLALANAKRIALENGTLISFSVDKDSLHTLQLRDSTLHYIMYEVGSNNGYCRAMRQNRLPSITNRSSLSLFLGSSNSAVRLCTLNAADIPRVLIDGHQLFYPLVYNQDGTNLKDPQWKNLLSIPAFAQGIIPLKSTEQSNKSQVIFNFMQVQKGILIPHILRYDLEKIRSILAEMESGENRELMKLILDERLDGCRNLFHACVHIAIPLTNKEYPLAEEESNSNNPKRLSFAIDLLHAQNNTDHNYGSATRQNPVEQPINAWPPGTTDASVTDAPALSSPTVPSGSTSGFYRSLSSGTNTATSETLSSKIQYLQSQASQQSSSAAAAGNYSFTPMVRSARATDGPTWPACKYDEREKRQRAIKILRLLLEFPLFQEHLLSLLSFRNLEGQTPFMAAVQARAYHCALILFEHALNIGKREPTNEQSVQFFLDASAVDEASRSSSSSSLLLRMIYPLTSTHSDYSPLYTICTNDTCSFTWTGEEHISQAIFECKTCGLEGTLCCCSECAQTCHKGHDCRLKRTSPTAYCDCWEVCKCKALINGDQQKRLELFKLLLNETNLVQIKNARYENLLLYLVQTVGRQLIEQQQFPRTSTAAMLQQQARKTREQMGNSATATLGGSSQPSKKLPHHPSGMSHSQPASNAMDFDSSSQINSIPDHHLEPPQFCK